MLWAFGVEVARMTGCFEVGDKGGVDSVLWIDIGPFSTATDLVVRFLGCTISRPTFGVVLVCISSATEDVAQVVSF